MLWVRQTTKRVRYILLTSFRGFVVSHCHLLVSVFKFGGHRQFGLREIPAGGRRALRKKMDGNVASSSASSTDDSRCKRVFALIDMDCFYVQVEQRFCPETKGKPCAVVQYKTWRGGG